MDKVEAILRRAFPERDAFSTDEMRFASLVLAASLVGDSRSSALPTRFVPVGDVVSVGGYRYLCVPRPAEMCPAAACWGCDISRKGRWCQDLQCGRFDRRDERNVWFVEVEDGE